MMRSKAADEADPVSLDKGPRRWAKWIVLGLLLMVCVVAAAVWVWQRPASLSAEEEKLVGKWTLPIGQQPPPNAIRQFFELRADRRLIASGQLITTKAPTGSSIGRWRIEAGDLVFELPPADSPVSLVERVLGKGPNLQGSVSRQRFLEADANRFRVEAIGGSVATFERVVE